MAKDQKKKTSRTGPEGQNSTLLELPQDGTQEVTPQVVEGTEGVKALQREVRATLEQTDKAMGTRDVALWDALCQLADTNEIVKQNFLELQVEIRRFSREFEARRIREDEYLGRLADEGEESYEKFQKEQRRIAREREKDRKHLTDLFKTGKQLAQEYRQCAQQKRYTVHISVVVPWKMAVEAAIYRHVTDEHTRQAIANDIRAAGAALCPVSADTDV